MDFYFDFISHNAWLAWGRAQELAKQHALPFRPVPVLFGVLLKANGQLGPAEIPAKGRWMQRDVIRKAIQYAIPLAAPHSHPFNPLAALRIASCDLAPDVRIGVIDRLFRAAWVESREVASPAVLKETLSSAGFDGAALVAESEGADAKARLRATTDAAIAAGIFGVPTVVVRERMFWGFDDLSFLEAFLDGRDPLDRATDLAAWDAVRPSVQRTR
jgi:2-hydroxychromene-2-carboxylate isomerase